MRRFTQLIGIYPVGNLVRLNTGEVAVVLKVYAPDPHRPQVRVLFDREGKRLALTYDLNLWEATDPERPGSIVAPLDPADYQIDPLTLIKRRSSWTDTRPADRYDSRPLFAPRAVRGAADSAGARGDVRRHRQAGGPAARGAGRRQHHARLRPPDVPCHRVIAAGGRLGGYGGYEMLKRSLLVAEGVAVVGGRVRDLKRIRWRPA